MVGDPVNLTDPSGLAFSDALGGFFDGAVTGLGVGLLAGAAVALAPAAAPFLAVAGVIGLATAAVEGYYLYTDPCASGAEKDRFVGESVGGLVGGGLGSGLGEVGVRGWGSGSAPAAAEQHLAWGSHTRFRRNRSTGSIGHYETVIP